MLATKIKGIINDKGELIIHEKLNLNPGAVEVLIYNATTINPDFDITLKRLLELKEIDSDLGENDQDQVYYPSDYAFNGCLELLNQLEQILGSNFPRGYADLESRGGINLIWNNQELNKKVWFEFPANEKFESSIYYQKDEQYNLIKQPETSQVAKLLQWLVTDELMLNY
jgi:hypothetical protein